MSQVPPEGLLDEVRHIAAWDLWFSPRLGKEAGEIRRRSYYAARLRSITSESEIEVSHKETRGFLSAEYKLTYTVADGRAARLEFTDSLLPKTGLRRLQSVRTYCPGEWEQRLHGAYRECLHLSNQWNSVSRLLDQLRSTSHTPKEMAELVEASGDIEETIKLVALSSEADSACAALSFAYAALGRCKEAKFVLETMLSTYPENAGCHLALGALFRGALYNANPPPRDSIASLRRLIETTGTAGKETLNTFDQLDPELHKALTDRNHELRVNGISDMLSQVTLEALGCSYDHAYERAEEQFTEAMRLATDKPTMERAKSALATLKTYRMADKAG